MKLQKQINLSVPGPSNVLKHLTMRGDSGCGGWGYLGDGLQLPPHVGHLRGSFLHPLGHVPLPGQGGLQRLLQGLQLGVCCLQLCDRLLLVLPPFDPVQETNDAV